jgi:hypothetical protein
MVFSVSDIRDPAGVDNMEDVIAQKKCDYCYLECLPIIRHFFHYPHVRSAAGRYNCSGERFMGRFKLCSNYVTKSI